MVDGIPLRAARIDAFPAVFALLFWIPLIQPVTRDGTPVRELCDRSSVEEAYYYVCSCIRVCMYVFFCMYVHEACDWSSADEALCVCVCVCIRVHACAV